MHLTAGTAAGMAGVLLDYPLDTVKTRMQVGGSAKATRHHHHAGPAAAASGACRGSGLQLPSSYWQCAVQVYQRGGPRAFYRGISVPLTAQGAEAAVVFSVYNVSLAYLLRRQQEARERAGSARRDGPHKRASRSHAHLDTAVPVWRSPAHWTASACAGLAVSFILTPVEMLKCNLQMESARPGWKRRHVTARGMARQIVSTHGVGGLYTGMTGTVMRAVLGNMAYFVSYEQCRQWLMQCPLTAPQDGVTVPLWHSLLAGGISGASYWSIAYPADVAKTKMQVCPTARQRGFGRTLVDIYHAGGVEALYRDWTIAVARPFLSGGVVFSMHEHASGTLQGLSSVRCVVVPDAGPTTAPPSSTAWEPRVDVVSHWS